MARQRSEPVPAEPPTPSESDEAAADAKAERHRAEQAEAQSLAEWIAGATIYQRMVAIIAQLPAIGKTMENTQQHFKFRGFDQVMIELNPLLAKYGVFIVPRVIERITDQRQTKSGGVMYEVNLHVEYTFYGANGDYIVGSAWGEGTDSGDKATNKAMTMAFKNVLHQAFAVNTEDTIDSDRTTDPETVGRASVRPDVAVENQNPPPRTWQDALARFDSLIGAKGEGSAWLEELMEKKYGVTTAGALDATQKRVIMVGFFSALMALEDQHGDLALQKGIRPIIQAAFSEKNDGLLLEGPLWALDPAEADTRPSRAEVIGSVSAPAESVPDEPPGHDDGTGYGG